MRFHDNTPSGGRKIVYEYMNYLVNKGNNISLCFVANTSFKTRKYNHLLYIKYYLDYLKRKKGQSQIDWFKLNSKIKIETRFSIDSSIADTDNQIIFAFDYGIALSIYDHLTNIRNCVYMIQHDERVYYDKNVIRQAWRLPMKKIVISTWLYKLVNSVDPGNVILVKNYVDLDTFYLTKPIEQRMKTVSLISHPNPYKGTKVGREALSLVKEQVPELRVIMFGTQPSPTDLPDYYEYYQMANESILREKVYNQSSVYLLPSVLEGWGLTATEAMSCGCALVSTKNGGVEDFGVDNYSALLCDVNNTKDISKKIISLLNDSSFRVKIANNGLEMVKSMNFLDSAQLFENVLYEINHSH
ncbi:polysaccharide biosynthesis protein [Amylolactobacillus amylotrophicus DSM 20534]|nr:polysaccharide biosynthesis protein [Amylolactobacillus amylotrophicus DSM 20534]KRM42653.1 polysaccharide biosynthesis protein [Amylolactobacillus amylophilus DSM 20533 = JCM 1125]